MSTSCLICCRENNTTYCARCQYNGDPSYVGNILKTTRDTYKKALELSKNGNFFELTEDGEPNRIDTHYNNGDSYEIKYCTRARLVDIIIHSDEFFEIDFIYYFNEYSNEWICFDSSGRKIRNENNQHGSSSSSLFFHEKRNNRRTTRKFESKLKLTKEGGYFVTGRIKKDGLPELFNSEWLANKINDEGIDWITDRFDISKNDLKYLIDLADELYAEDDEFDDEYDD